MKRIAIISGLVSFFFLASISIGQPKGGQVSPAPAAAAAPLIPLGYDTTRIMAPLKADGLVDYITVLNERSSKDMAAKDNAAAILVLAFDPEKFFAKGTSQKAFEALGVANTDRTEYFKDFFVDGKAVAPGSEKFYETHQTEPWKSEDNPEVAQWLKDNDAPLEKIVEACKLTKYFIPIIAGPNQVPAPTPGMTEVRHAAKALMLRANMAIGDGKFADAWRDITAAYRLGTLYGQQPLLTDRAAGAALVGMSLNTAENFLNWDKLPRGQARGRLASFVSTQFPAVPDVAATIDTGERYLMLLDLTLKFHGPFQDRDTAAACLKEVGLDKIPPEFALKVFEAIPDSSLQDMAKQINDYCDQMFKVMTTMPTYGQQAAEFKKFNDQAMLLKGELLKPKYLQSDDAATLTKWANDYLLFSITYGFPKAQLASYHAATQKKLVTIALALAAYKSDKGKYPGALTDLTAEVTTGTGSRAVKTPGYLKTMPMDFFTDKSDKPFSYKIQGNGYILYSVGENMKDDSGKGPDQGGDDIVIQKL